MSKRLIKHFLSLAIIAVVALPILGFSLNAQALSNEDLGMDTVQDSDLKLGDTDPRETASSIINVALMFLGIIAVVIILIGGFKWMTAAGNEEKVGEAKKLMGQGVIGLVIVLSAWGIAKFILEQLVDATG